MPEPNGTLRAVSWSEICPWLRLFRVFRCATQMRMLFLGAAGFGVMLAGWSGIAYVFKGSEDDWVSSWVNEYRDVEWTGDPDPHEPLPSAIEQPADFGAIAVEPFVSSWWKLSSPFRQVFAHDSTISSIAFSLLAALWATVVWAVCGGAICRIAALYFALDQRLGLRAALAFARRKILAYFFAPWFPMIGLVLVMSLPLAIAGLLFRWNLGAAFLAVLWPVALVAGLLMAIVAVGLFFGWPLMWSAVSAEGLDSFDAMGRAYHYVGTRPINYLAYAGLVGVLGALSTFFISAFAHAVAYLPQWAAAWGTGYTSLEAFWRAESGDSVVDFARRTMDFWQGAIDLVVHGFLFSFFFSASTGIYFLLRRDTDGTELEEVHPEETSEGLELPPLATDSQGVPVVPPAETQPPPAPMAE